MLTTKAAALPSGSAMEVSRLRTLSPSAREARRDLSLRRVVRRIIVSLRCAPINNEECDFFPRPVVAWASRCPESLEFD